MPNKRSSRTVRHRAITSTPQTTTYTWHDVTCPSPLDTEDQRLVTPQNRCKHAACLHDDHVYVCGGRNGGVCHGDLWRYSLSDKTWLELTCHGDTPQSPQEHTILAYKNNLYLFGGQFWCSYDNEAPLWILNLETLMWKRNCIQSEVLTPGGRRGHTAVIHNAVMYIFGGYIDLKGSSSELWLFDLEAEMWHLSNKSHGSETTADARHGHSAVVYDGAMFVYGGMSNLAAKDDLWQYNFESCRWTRIRSRPSPPPLKGHTACVIADQMLVFGGTSQGSLVNTLWCFHFGSNSWCRISVHGSSPPASLQHAVVVDLAVGDVTATDQGRSSSHPQLQSSRHSSSSLEPRPRSSPASLTSYRVVETEISTSLIKNKVVPSRLPSDFDRSFSNVTGSSEHCTQQATARNHRILRDIPGESKSTNIMEITTHTDDSFYDVDDYLPHASTDCTTLHSLHHKTPVNGILTSGSPVHKKAVGKHKYGHLSDSQENCVKLFDDVAHSNLTSHRNGFGNDAAERACHSSDTLLMAHSVIVANDLKLEDIEDDEMLSSLYLEGATSQYIMNDSLASSTDILNLSNSSETTSLVNHKMQQKAGEKLKRTNAVPPCTSPSHKPKSVESLPYGVLNPNFRMDNGYLSSSIKELENGYVDITRQNCPIGTDHLTCNNCDVVLPYCLSEEYDDCSSPDINKNGSAVKESDDDLLSKASTIFSNPCYFSEFDADAKETIEMCDLNPQFGGIKSDTKKNVFSASEDATSSHKMCEVRELNGTNKIDNSMVHSQQETSRKRLTRSVTKSTLVPRSTTPVLTPALPLIDQHRLYNMYIIGGQTAECKRFGYNPINLWQLTVSLDRR